MKTCTKCKQNKDLKDFYKDKSEKDGYNNQCKPCVAIKQKKHYYKNPQKRTELKRKFEVLRKYGITLDQYNQMVIDQNGLCKICNKPETDPHKKNLSIDHCHLTGKVRGLLCNHCNRGIGLLKEDYDILQRAADYLRTYSENKSGWS